MLAIPFLIMCGMMGSNCSDSDFLWAETAYGYTAMDQFLGVLDFLSWNLRKPA